MRIFIAVSLSLLVFVSCHNPGTDQLNRRVDRIEQKIDSISGATATTPDHEPERNAYRTSLPEPGSSHCHAITKKGKPCSRKARSNSYCWQHGG